MKLNLSKLNSAIESSLAATNKTIARNADKALKAKRWDWDRVTRRRSGEIVYTPRDIIDTGALKRSIWLQSGKRSAVVRYKARHAAIVHRRRPWLKTALKETDVLKVFANELRSRI